MQRIKRAIENLLPKSRFLRGVVMIAGSTAFGQALAVLASPILTRLYTPGEFGALGVYASILSILSVVASCRYEMAIPLPEEHDFAANVLFLSIALLILNTILVLTVILLFGNHVLSLVNAEALHPYSWLLSVGFFSVGLYGIFSYWAIRKKSYSVIAKTRITRTFGMVITQTGLGIWKFGCLGLLLGHLLGQAGGVGTILLQTLRQDMDCLRRVSMKGIWRAACRYRRFPIYMNLASLLNSAGMQVPALLFAALYGPQVAGWFFLTQRVLAMPVSLVATSVSQVFLGEVAELANNDPARLQHLFNRITRQMFLIALIPCLILAIGGHWIFEVVFGEAWAESGTYIQVMVFVFVLKFAADSAINLALIEKQNLSFYWGILRLLLVIAAIAGANQLGLSAFAAVAFYTAAMVVSYAVKYVMWILSIKKLILVQKASPISLRA